MERCKVALADDHVLIRSAVAALINTFEDFCVVCQADNGLQLLQRIRSGSVPDIVLLDIEMPELDGFETARLLRESYPAVKVLALSMYDNEQAIIHMLKNGARGYILKDAEPRQLKEALTMLRNKDYYYSDLVTGTLIHSMADTHTDHSPVGPEQLNERESTFLKYACTELSYKQIADRMSLSPRTVDGYRDHLFLKLHVKSRVGLVLYAIKHQVVEI
jgi:two-component system invasion response regulator UvrY